MKYCTFVLLLIMSLGAFAQSGQYSDLIREYFDEGQLTSTLTNQLGRGLISLLHPTCDHSSTVITSHNSNKVRFRTEYSGWINEHVMIWEVELSTSTLISRVNFISDTSPVQSGMAANMMQGALIDLFERTLD